MILVFVLRRFGSRGEARRWPLALGWISEDDRRTKPLHWVCEPWCGMPLADCLACVCPATREATRCYFVRVSTCWWKHLDSKFHKDQLWAKLSTRILVRKGFLFITCENFFFFASMLVCLFVQTFVLGGLEIT